MRFTILIQFVLPNSTNRVSKNSNLFFVFLHMDSISVFWATKRASRATFAPARLFHRRVRSANIRVMLPGNGVLLTLKYLFGSNFFHRFCRISSLHSVWSVQTTRPRAGKRTCGVWTAASAQYYVISLYILRNTQNMYTWVLRLTSFCFVTFT